ncbi:MAG TPA: hypothetical protein VID71_11240 [Steroidobacteraceae bacterium]|jgi:hypothetical protein
MADPFQRRFRHLQRAMLGVLSVAFTLGALAQTAAPRAARRTPPLNGTVEALSGQTLLVNTSEHGEVSVTLPAATRIVEQRPASLDEVKAGEFIGATAVQGADGKLHATEVHIFPDSMRGTGEGHYPMGAPTTTMTNGNVEAVTGSVAHSQGEGSGAEQLRITYKGGQTEVQVPRGVTVTLMRIADKSVLQMGAHVTVLLAPGAQAGAGGPTAATVFVREPSSH